MSDSENKKARLCLNEKGYFETAGLNVMLAHDFYPEGHQGGVSIIQNGCRIATNGDLRLEPSPGQWSPIPKLEQRIVSEEKGEITAVLSFPDESKNRTGFNPIEYPDLEFRYTVRVISDDPGFRIVVDLESPLLSEWQEQVGFNLELFPPYFWGKSFQSGSDFGVFPRQAIGQASLATGTSVCLAAEENAHRLKIDALVGGHLQLIDGRAEHNNGWFIIRANLLPGATTHALEWYVTPSVLPDWRSAPVVQISQIGYHTAQAKVAVIETDRSDPTELTLVVERISEMGPQSVLEGHPTYWGNFLRFRYLTFDFSGVDEPGLYRLRLGSECTETFRIADDVFAKGVWQPTVETFLPVQMCHMLVRENYRVWHGRCHMDDAKMAPINCNHFDGYLQGDSTLTQFEPGDFVPDMAMGGWHDAGDYDIRVESQSDTVYGLALAYEEFGLDYDNTTIDQETQTVEMLRPDGHPDVLQQIEHGCLSIVRGYQSLGRLYRGIIEPTLRQYTHLGDASTVTDNMTGTDDDRWVFTEDHASRELEVATSLAAASRVLRALNPTLAVECLDVAESIYRSRIERPVLERFAASIELYLATGLDFYRHVCDEAAPQSLSKLQEFDWVLARYILIIETPNKKEPYEDAMAQRASELSDLANETPYGIQYRPAIWGAGWNIQRFGVRQYWLHQAFPDLFTLAPMLSALNFVLGCHPGSNTASFVSGVGARSMIPGYGVNRAENSYIPGGIGSGTALIRPDLPELLEWPYLWQQTEYCVGYPTSDFVFLAAAADFVLNQS